MTDLNFINDGYYIQLLANTKNGEYIFNQIASHFDGNAKFPVSAWPSIKVQIKSAGYTVRKARKISVDSIDVDELLSVLNA